MKIGTHVPQWGPYATRSGVLDVARCAEAAGLDSVWVADHIVFPMESKSAYPYRSAGVPFKPEDGFLEALTTLAVVAGATERIFLGTSVFILPMREPLLAAKAIATLDVLSGGRTVIAVGAGWWREEFDSVGVDFGRRGRCLDDQLSIFRDAWNEGTLRRDRGAYRFEDVASLPLPIQPGGPQLWIGGMGKSAWRRTIDYGHGWHAVGSDLDTILEGRRQIDKLARANGRDPATIAISTSTGLGRSVEQAIDRLSALRDGGLDQVVLNIGGPDASSSDICRAIDEYAAHVRPSVFE